MDVDPGSGFSTEIGDDGAVLANYGADFGVGAEDLEEGCSV